MPTEVLDVLHRVRQSEISQTCDLPWKPPNSQLELFGEIRASEVRRVIV